MRGRAGRWLLLLAVGLGVGGGGRAGAAGEAPSVQEIIDKANQVAYYQGKDGRAQVLMTITDAQGRTQSREFTILRRNSEPAAGASDATPGEQKSYVYFQRPADIRRTVFLVWKHLDREDDRWLYLPALDLVKRIAAADKRTSFVGANFFYEDVSGRRVSDDTHELLKVTDTYYQVRNTPKDPASVEFAYFDLWIHRQTFLPVSAEYYDRNGEKYRVYTALEVKDIDGYQTVVRSRMEDLRTKGSTLLEYSDVKYNLGLPEDIFTERYLRNPPREYLR